ncbi:MAG TPA: LPS-assembly protein LptD, partial [Myxococcaceae bacterium]
PGFTFALPERQLAGRWAAGMRIEYTRLSPLTRTFGDEGEEGLFNAAGCFLTEEDKQKPVLPWCRLTTDENGNLVLLTDPGQSNGIFDSADREARSRLDFSPRLTTSVGLGRFMRLTPALALRQDFYLGEVSGRFNQRGYPMADLVLDSELARVFQGRTSAYRHSLRPAIHLRYVPTVWGEVPSPGASPELPPQIYDEIDAALPRGPDGRGQSFFHAVAEVTQALQIKEGDQRREVLRLRLGQGFDLSRRAPMLSTPASEQEDGPLLRDTFAQLSTSAGVLNGRALVRYDPNTQKISQFSVDASVTNTHGEALYVRYDDLQAEGSDQLRRGIDALVGPSAESQTRAQLLVAGARMSLGIGLGMRYEAIVQPLARTQSPLAQQVLGVSYGPACDCWRIEGVATLRRDQKRPDFGFNLSVAGVGAFGSGG